MSKKGAVLQKDAPWRASPYGKPVPRIHHSPVLRVAQNPFSNYALSVMKHPNPIGSGLGSEAIVEAAGPDCIVPGQVAPIKLLGLKVLFLFFTPQKIFSFIWLILIFILEVWPINIDLKFVEPVGRELKSIGKVQYRSASVTYYHTHTGRSLRSFPHPFKKTSTWGLRKHVTGKLLASPPVR
ncbi:hypothetical protein RJ640_007114 [Escallonia rubra]|uniref:Uncharacterized protein n=1 Tax=Escallonia rubra TaxID=112253 RepID=A0AA88RWG3_9ASTE|nr:hypothetical protein RJ640_007114 [Escallonia rubra]